jgi:hypothetical protein
VGTKKHRCYDISPISTYISNPIPVSFILKIEYNKEPIQNYTKRPIKMVKITAVIPERITAIPRQILFRSHRRTGRSGVRDGGMVRCYGVVKAAVVVV